MSKLLEKSGSLRRIVGIIKKSYVNRIIHKEKNKKMLINLWIMWISGKKGSKIKGLKSG